MTSFVRSYMRGAFLRFFPSSNKFNGFHIYNTLVSQISIEILGYFRQLPPFPSRLRTASTGRPSLAVLRHVGGHGGHRRHGRRGRHRGHFKLGAIVYSARAVIKHLAISVFHKQMMRAPSSFLRETVASTFPAPSCHTPTPVTYLCDVSFSQLYYSQFIPTNLECIRSKWMLLWPFIYHFF